MTWLNGCAVRATIGLGRVALAALAIGVAFTATVTMGASDARAAGFTPVSQSRVVEASTQVIETGFTCLDSGSGGPPLPACPVTLQDVTTPVTVTAPGFSPDPFIAQPTSEGQAVVSHVSSIGSHHVLIEGSAIAQGASSEVVDASYVLRLLRRHRYTSDLSEVTVTLDEAAQYHFNASGAIHYPSPQAPVGWDVDVAITLTGPGGEIAALTIEPDFGCPIFDPITFDCLVEPAPLSVSGTLAPGTYTLSVVHAGQGLGGWWPSQGPISGYASAEYSASLQLESAPPVPVAGVFGHAVLAAAAIWAGARRLGRPPAAPRLLRLIPRGAFRRAQGRSVGLVLRPASVCCGEE